MTSTRRPARLAGLVALGLALPAAAIDLPAFLASWLVAWWYLVGLVLGGMANLWMHRLTGGRWGEALRPAALRAAQGLPWLLLCAVPLAAGMGTLYPWVGGTGQQGFVGAWLQPGPFALRATLYGALWWWLARPASLAHKGRAAASLALYLFSGTLAAVDLLASLVPGWSSSGFGLVVLSGQALSGAALGTLVASRLADRPAAPPPPTESTPVPVGRDLGNLLLMWLMLWGYLAFMEFLVIWSEDLPRETVWYLPRLRTGWAGVGAALALLQLAVPLLALLQRRIKDRPAPLAAVAALLLGTQLLNTAWLILPSVAPHGWLGWWCVPLLTAAMALGVYGGPPLRGLGKAPGVAHAGR